MLAERRMGPQGTRTGGQAMGSRIGSSGISGTIMGAGACDRYGD
jgi:hypothetical protein